MNYYNSQHVDSRQRFIPDRIVDRPHVPTPVREDYVSRQTYRLACRLAKKGRVQS